MQNSNNYVIQCVPEPYNILTHKSTIILFTFAAKFAYRNTGLKSRPACCNLRKHLLKIIMLEIKFMSQSLLPGLSKKYVCTYNFKLS